MNDISMDSFSDEIIKMAKIGRVLEFIKRHKKPLGIAGLVGGGYVAGKGIEQTAKDYALGRRVRKQYEKRGG